jgi:hypothetical protein
VHATHELARFDHTNLISHSFERERILHGNPVKQDVSQDGQAGAPLASISSCLLSRDRVFLSLILSARWKWSIVAELHSLLLSVQH